MLRCCRLSASTTAITGSQVTYDPAHLSLVRNRVHPAYKRRQAPAVLLVALPPGLGKYSSHLGSGSTRGGPGHDGPVTTPALRRRSWDTRVSKPPYAGPKRSPDSALVAPRQVAGVHRQSAAPAISPVTAVEENPTNSNTPDFGLPSLGDAATGGKANAAKRTDSTIPRSMRTSIDTITNFIQCRTYLFCQCA